MLSDWLRERNSPVKVCHRYHVITFEAMASQYLESQRKEVRILACDLPTLNWRAKTSYYFYSIFHILCVIRIILASLCCITNSSSPTGSTPPEQDVALLKLKIRANIGGDVNTVCLRTPGEEYNKHTCTIAGWGNVCKCCYFKSDSEILISVFNFSFLC